MEIRPIKIGENIMSIIVLMTLIVGCQFNRDEYLNRLRTNLHKIDSLRVSIEEKYTDRLIDTSRPRLLFKHCQNFERGFPDFVCTDLEILRAMDELSINNISFEAKKCEEKNFSEVYFQMSQAGQYPVIYFLYERCGAGDAFESRDIYYEPIDDHWGVYIDSNVM